MNVVRAAGRACFAAFFVVDGLDMADRSSQDLAGVQTVLNRALPVVRRFAPTWVGDHLPDDAVGWSKAIAAVQIGAGVCYGMGILPRPAAAVLTVASAPKVVSGLVSSDPRERRDTVLRGLALFGAALVATQDKRQDRSLLRKGLHGMATVGLFGMRTMGRMGYAAATSLLPARVEPAVAVTQAVADDVLTAPTQS